MNKLVKVILASSLVSISMLSVAQEAQPELMAFAPKTKAASNVEPNAFVRQRFSSAAKLVEHAKTDEVVMDRYMRHFGMTRDQVLDFLGGLKMDRLKEDGVYLVYNVPESGELRARSIYYKKGTAVLTDAAGNLVMKASCGNPMMRGTDKVDQPVVANLTEDTALAPLPSAGVTGTSEAVAMDTIQPTEPEAAALVAAPTSMPLDIAKSSSSFNAAWLLPVAAGALLIKTPGDDDDPVCDPATNPQCVPEPATMIMMAIGAGGLAARRLRKKS